MEKKSLWCSAKSYCYFSKSISSADWCAGAQVIVTVWSDQCAVSLSMLRNNALHPNKCRGRGGWGEGGKGGKQPGT